MIIGYDAKRAFQNRTGLGNYSRTLLRSLAENYGEHAYYLFAPKQTALFAVDPAYPVYIKTPQWQPAKLLPSLWRSLWMTRDLKKAGVQLYHGLSNELPAGLQQAKIPAVVTVHDLIFEKFPQYYHRSEVVVYKKKFRAACEAADAIIATSVHTKKDIVELYKIDPGKIHVGYQSCDEAYWKDTSAAELQRIKKLYALPDQYFLYVGSITERKDLLTICKALHLLGTQVDFPLVVVGEGKHYKKQVQEWLAAHAYTGRVIFLSDTAAAKASREYHTGKHFPAIYQNALASIYPSLYEGFGIPVLESQVSGTPVIIANATSLPEVGGEAALYFKPGDVEGLAYSMQTIAFNETLRIQSSLEGRQHAKQFSAENCAKRVMQVYKSLLF